MDASITRFLRYLSHKDSSTLIALIDNLRSQPDNVRVFNYPFTYTIPLSKYFSLPQRLLAITNEEYYLLTSHGDFYYIKTTNKQKRLPLSYDKTYIFTIPAKPQVIDDLFNHFKLGNVVDSEIVNQLLTLKDNCIVDGQSLLLDSLNYPFWLYNYCLINSNIINTIGNNEKILLNLIIRHALYIYLYYRFTTDAFTPIISEETIKGILLWFNNKYQTDYYKILARTNTWLRQQITPQQLDFNTENFITHKYISMLYSTIIKSVDYYLDIFTINNLDSFYKKTLSELVKETSNLKIQPIQKAQTLLTEYAAKNGWYRVTITEPEMITKAYIRPQERRRPNRAVTISYFWIKSDIVLPETMSVSSVDVTRMYAYSDPEVYGNNIIIIVTTETAIGNNHVVRIRTYVNGNFLCVVEDPNADWQGIPLEDKLVARMLIFSSKEGRSTIDTVYGDLEKTLYKIFGK